MAGATAIAAALTWALQVFAGRLLGPEDYAAFMVVWGLVFFLVGTLLGVQQEVTRDLTANESRPRGARGGVSAVRLGVVVGLALGLAELATSSLWSGPVFGTTSLAAAAALAVATLLYSVANSVYGGLASEGAWGMYSGVIVVEAVLRAGLVVPVLAMTNAAGWQVLALGAAGVAWAFVRPGRSLRWARRPLSAGLPLAAGRAGQAMVATACSAALVAGFPVLLQLTSPHGLGAEAGTVIAVVTVTRAPLLLALNAYQALLIRRFTLERGHLRGELRRIVVPTIALATLLTALAWLLGPWALRLVFGAAFSPSRALVAGLAANAGLLVLLSICALAVLSLGSQRTYAAVWLAATVVSVLALTLPLGVEARTMLALAVGPAVGIGLSLLRIARDAQAEGRA